MAYALPPAEEFFDRGTFSFHTPTTSQFSYITTKRTTQCRNDEFGECVEELYRSASGAASIAEKVNCIIVPDLTVSLAITKRVAATITEADINAVIQRIMDGYSTGDPRVVTGLIANLGVTT